MTLRKPTKSRAIIKRLFNMWLGDVYGPINSAKVAKNLEIRNLVKNVGANFDIARDFSREQIYIYMLMLAGGGREEERRRCPFQGKKDRLLQPLDSHLFSLVHRIEESISILVFSWTCSTKFNFLCFNIFIKESLDWIRLQFLASPLVFVGCL